jgi:hypothetical protein
MHCPGAALCYGRHTVVCEVGAVMRLVAVLVLAAATAAADAAPSAPPAPAPTTEQLFSQFGLFGTWAVDCGQSASAENPRVSISMPSPGVIIQDHDLGVDNEHNRYSILSAKKLSDTRISVQVIFQPGREGEEHERLIWAVRKNTLRTLFNQPQDGPVRVKDGVAVGYGIKMPVLKKCE